MRAPSAWMAIVELWLMEDAPHRAQRRLPNRRPKRAHIFSAAADRNTRINTNYINEV
jgi:hypothetical protein